MGLNPNRNRCACLGEAKRFITRSRICGSEMAGDGSVNGDGSRPACPNLSHQRRIVS
jgi:hypothetical protein